MMRHGKLVLLIFFVTVGLLQAQSPVEVNLRLMPTTDERFNGLVEIVNVSEQPINGWELSFVTAADIQGFLAAIPYTIDKEANYYSVTDTQDNAFILPGESIMIALRGRGRAVELTQCRFNDVPCYGQGVKGEQDMTAMVGISQVFSQGPTPSTLPLTIVRELGAEDGSNGPRIVGYYTGWSIYKNYHVNDIPADKLTHINYAFINIDDEHRCVLGDPFADIKSFYHDDDLDNDQYFGNFNQLRKLKAKHPQVKVLLSVGGWLWSNNFSDAVADETSRERLVDSCIELLQDYDFDGLDYAWQYPVESDRPEVTTREEDKTNYTQLVELTRKKLDLAGMEDAKYYLLTVATSALPQRYLQHLELARLAPHVDWFNVLTYDYHGAWEPMTNHHAPLYANALDPANNPMIKRAYNINSTVNNYLYAGVPPEKIVIGIGLYGRAWSGLQSIVNQGLYTYTDGSMPAASNGNSLPGVFDYRDIFNHYLTDRNYQRVWDDSAKVPFLVNQTTGMFISYDDPESVATKTQYVLNNSLGGIALWELSGDVAITPWARRNQQVEDYYQLVTTAHSILFPEVLANSTRSRRGGLSNLQEHAQGASDFADQQGLLGSAQGD